MSASMRKLALCILVGIIVVLLIKAIVGFIARLVVIALLGALVLFVLGVGRSGDD